MKCPICEKQINNTVQQCPNCGFTDLRTEFINENELKMWQTYVVYPCRFAYQTSVAQIRDLERKFKKELSAIQKEHKEVQESQSSSGGENSTFKKFTLDKNDGWVTEGNVTYKKFCECKNHSSTKCEICNIVLNIIEDRMTADFFVKKTFDLDGQDSTFPIGFKWKFKDDYGILVADGSWCNSNMQVGDVTKASISIRGLDNSVKYVLEFVNL